MSVVVIARFPVSHFAKAIEGLKAQTALLVKISEDNKRSGGLHHRVAAGDGELIVLDEWATAEQFQSFFEGNADIEQITAALGVTGPPTVSVCAPVDDVPGTF